MTTRVLHVGLGPIGAAVVCQLVKRPQFRVVGAVDIDPAKAGRDVGEICGIGRALRVKVSADLASTIKASRPDVAVLCTGSSLEGVLPLFKAVLKFKVPIVSTTEELAYPVKDRADAARTLDRLAKRAGVAVFGTGINPGFMMDALPIALTAVSEGVSAIEIDRIQDARIRRLPFQQKIGAGLTRAEFLAGVADGSVRHVGLAESITMIADAMGWTLDRITETVAPKIAAEAVSSQFLSVPRGRVAGIIQDGIGYVQGRALIKLHMEAYLGAPETYDAVRISGNPPLTMKVTGVHGDICTAAMVVNSIPKVRQAAPGLQTMRDLALPSFAG
ncbi:MAG: dihydrodipicolinate reductase [Acidobacteriota bacterium]